MSTFSAATQDSSAGKPVRVPAWLYGTFIVAVFYIAWHLRRPARDTVTARINLGVLSTLSVVALLAMFQACRRSEFPVRVRKGLAYITAGLAISTLGSLCLFLPYLVVGRTPEIFGIDDVLSLALYPLSIAGLLYFPVAGRRAAGSWRILIDGAAFVVGVGVPLWLVSVRPVLATVHGPQAVQYILWPLLAFGGIIVVNSSLLTRQPIPSRRAFWTLLAALGTSWVSDLFSSLNAPDKILVDGSINWIDISVAISLCLYALAAWRFRTDPLPAAKLLRPAAFSPMPMITVVAVVLWATLMVVGESPDPEMHQRMLVSVVFLLVVLLARETLVLRDSLRWVAAEAQRESQARFEAIVKHSSDAIMVVDRAGRIHYASPATALALGRTAEQLVGSVFLDLVGEPERPKATAFFDELARHPGPEVMTTLRWRHQNADGSHRHFETHGSNLPVESSGGGFVLNSRDVTERLMMDERMHQAQKMEAVGRLAGGVAHDFNNLLAVVLANSELGLLGLPSGHPVRNDLEEIRRTSVRGATLTGRLLAFGRRQNLRPQVISPAALLRDTRPFLERLVGAAVTLETHYAADLPSVRVDPHDLEQALLHLVTNACDAMAKSGGVVRVSLRAESLHKALASNYLTAAAGRYVVVAVADNGAGMDEATRARIFEPFFSTKERARAAGLGLASVFGMVKTAGGGIVVQSAPGQGTSIELWLPEVLDKAPTPEAKVAPVTPAKEAGITILLVEDEAGVRKGIQRILEQDGYVVLPAGNAQEARAVFAQPAARGVKLLLTDVIMPGQSGPRLAADLVSERPNLRVLFMSGYTGDELQTDEFARVGGDLLCKPFTADELAAKVRHVLAAPPRSG